MFKVNFCVLKTRAYVKNTFLLITVLYIAKEAMFLVGSKLYDLKLHQNWIKG